MKDKIMKIEGREYKINSQQSKELKELLKDYKKTTFIEFKSFNNPLVRIVIEGLIFELAKRTFFNYKDMISDIIKED